MQVQVVKAKKAYGFTELLDVINAGLDDFIAGMKGEDSKKGDKARKEWDIYKKPSFFQDRPIKIVSRIPQRVRDETIYVHFMRNGYEIKSGRNFIHTPIAGYGNLRYALITETAYNNEEVLKNLKETNYGKIIK